MDARTYQVNQSTITLLLGDITTSKAEVLVSSDDYELSMSGGVSRAIARAAGEGMVAEARKLVPARVGAVLVTSTGNLAAKYIFHAVTIGERPLELEHDAIVRQTARKAMQLLPWLGGRSIAFPAIGAGFAGIAYDVVAAQMASVLVGTLLETSDHYAVELYLMDRFGGTSPERLFGYFEQYVEQTLGVATSQRQSGYVLAPPAAAVASLDPEQGRETERQHQVFEMVRHLDARRGQLETALITALTAEEACPTTVLTDLRRNLAEIQELRRGYVAELTGKPFGPPVRVPRAVFLSSTALDLQPHRKALRGLIERLGFPFIGMEDFYPDGQPPATYIRQRVEQADLYFGVIGMRYGSMEASTGLSMTELEYRQALASNKDLAIFVMDKDAPITVGMIETDPQGFARLLDFRSRVLKAHVCGLFTDVSDLIQQAEQALAGRRPRASG